VNDQVERQALAIDLHRHRVDQKRHVVTDDLDHRMGRLPAVLLEARIVDANARAARLPAHEMPVTQHGPVEIGNGKSGEVVRIDLPEILACEGLGERCLILRQLAANHLEHRFEL
jgi:hypothetical protein